MAAAAMAIQNAHGATGGPSMRPWASSFGSARGSNMTKSLTRMDIDGQAFQGEWGGVPKRERVMHAALFRLDSKGHWQPRNVVLTADRLIILARKQPVHREGRITHLGSTDSEHQQHVDAYICTCTCIGMSMCIRICTCVYMHMHEYMYMYMYKYV
jgi:hypothetical protein